MTTSPEAVRLVRQLQECFNARQFDQAAGLHAPHFFSHPLDGGFDVGKNAWATMTARYPDMRVIAQDVLVDGDKAAVRSTVAGITGVGSRDPEVFEIFRFEDGLFAEAWGATTAFPPAGSPEDLVG